MNPERRGTKADLFDTATAHALLTELAERLAARRVPSRIYVVGGAAMALAYYDEGERRLTNDIDASLAPAALITDEAVAIAAEHGLRPGWLNAKAVGFLPAHGRQEGVTIITRDHVRVEVAPPKLLLAMKLRAARLGRDDDDIAVLLRRCDIRSIDEARSLLHDCYDGEEPFTDKANMIVQAALAEYRVMSGRPPFTLAAMARRPS
ncbi:MAG: hypothetical protein ABIV94_05725 [Acidimicrobiales bacterium]